MASNPGSNQATDKTDNNDDGLLSTFQTTVCLRDWWLIKAENDSHEKRLAIAGFTSKEQRAVRVFSSAPIAKRFDTFTLETVDGVCIFIKGFINQQRTTENGFPCEVFSHFVFGFPSYWEQYAAKCLEQDSDSESESPNKCEHTIHEDRKEAEVSKDLSHKVSANIGIGVSKVSNADGKIDQVNITTTSVRRSNRMSTNELNDGCVKDGLQQTSSVKRGRKFRNRSIILKNSTPTSTHFSESESPNKCEHTIHEDRKEAEVSEDLSHKVSANIGIGVSKVSSADGKIDQVNITTTSVRRSNRMSTNELNDGCVKDGLRQTSSVKRGHKFRNRSIILKNSTPTSTHFSESESPNKCEHTIHEDRKEAEVSEDLSHKVSANIGIGVLKVSDADGKIDQVNITTTSVRRSNRLSNNELNDGCLKDGLQQTSSVKRGHKFRSRSIILKNSTPTSTHFAESESPNKCEHAIHEDRKEAEVSEDLSHKVSANIGIGVSKVSNAGGKIDQVNITTTSVRRSNRLSNNELNDGCLKDGLQQTSSVKRGHKFRNLQQTSSVKRGHKFRNRSIILKNSTPTSTHFSESESPNKCEHTIHEDRKEAEVSEDLSHKVSANIGIGVSKVSNAESKIDQVNITTTSVRRSNRLSNNELNDGCVKDGLQQTSSVKRGHKFRNRKTQGSVQNVRKSRSDGSVVGFDKKNQTKDSNIAVGEGETYSKERSSSRKKPMRKLNFDTHVTPCKQEALAKVSVVSPETSSFKRSRSGRVLLPTLEFWRNQMPIYDADHKLIGVQEAERPRGS